MPEESFGSFKQQGYNETYSVTHWETFEVDVGSLTFCVRHWPATASWPARHELSAQYLLENRVSGSRMPALLWDVDSSVPFDWVPPSPLPATEGCQQVDFARKCVATQFQATPRGWKLTLMWLVPASAQTGQDVCTPSRLIAQVQSQDGRRIMHPVTGRSFQIPLACSPSVRAGPQPLHELQAMGVTPHPGMELSEVRKDLEQVRLQYQQCEALIVDREKEAKELQRQVAELPSLEYFADLGNRLDESSAHRRKCQVELLELRGRPRLFCMLLPSVDPQESHAVKRHARSEVVVPSLWQNFEFDFIVELQDREVCQEAWQEVRPVLDSVLRRPASYACVLLASCELMAPARSRNLCAVTSRRRHRKTIARMVDHLFESIADGAQGNESMVGVASVSMVEVTSHNNFRNLLQDDVVGTLVSDVRVLAARTSHEVMDAYDAGMKGLTQECGHTVFSICVQRYDASAREAACAGRLVVVEMTRPHEGCGHSPSDVDADISKAIVERQLTDIAKVTKVCMECTSEAWSIAFRPTAAVGSAALQAKTLIVASVSRDLCDLQASLPMLQFASASSILHERASKADDSGCRRQLAKMLQENQRLRAELAERGRLPKQLQVPPEKMDTLSSSATKTTSHSTPALPSPRDRYMDCHRTSSGGPTPRSGCLGTKDTCVPEGRRRSYASSCLLPSR